jgi:tetratricopeptide (TPR) repeat protein
MPLIQLEDRTVRLKPVLWTILGVLLFVGSASADEPKTASDFYVRGLKHELKGMADEAMADYAKAIELDPKHRSSYSRRGDVYMQKGKYDEAIADYTKNINLIEKPDANHAPIYEARGNAYCLKGKYDDAIVDYTSAINLNSGGIGSYCYNRGLAYQAQGERDKAIADFRRSIANYQEWLRLSPDNKDVKERLEAAKKKLSEAEK